jgi:hypothetical protein
MFLLFGGLFVAGIITTISTAAQLDEVSRIGLLSWAVSGLFELLIVVWLWSMGSFLSSIVHPALRLNARFFQLTLIYALLYVLVFMTFLQQRQSLVFAVVIPLHLFAMFCMFYKYTSFQRAWCGGNRQARVVLRLCRTLLSGLVFPDCSLDRSTEDQPAL